MALDDYSFGKGLHDLIEAGKVKEDELENSQRVKLRSYRTVRTGQGVTELLEKGHITQEQIDANPEFKLGVQAYNTQRELDKGLFERMREPDPAVERDLKRLGVDPNFKSPLERGVSQIDLSGETEPSAIQRFVGENLPQGVLNTLADIQPTLAVAGETATAGALKLPKVREPGFGEEMVGIALGVVPQILATRGLAGPSIREFAAARNLNPLQTEIILDLAATELSRAAALGVEDQFLAPEQRRGPGGILSQLGWEGAGSIGGTAAGAGIARAGGALLREGSFEAVPGFRQALKRAEASLTGTPDEFPPGTIDELADLVETEGQRAFREALEEVSTQTQPTRQAARTATRQATTIIPDEFQAPTTRKTPLEQEFGLPKGSDTESPAPTAAAAEEPEPRPQEPEPAKPVEEPAPEPARATESAPEPEAKPEAAPRPKYEGIETYGIREDRLDKLREAAANARVLKSIEEQFGITVPRKAKTEVLDAEKVATATEKAQTGELTGKEKLTTVSRKADSTLEKILYNPQKSASRNAKKLGLSKKQFDELRDEIGERAIAEETASGALRARRETMIRAILDEGITLDKDKEALLRADLDDLTIGPKASTTEPAIDASTPKTTTRDVVQEKNLKLGADEEVVTPANTKAKTKFALVDSADIKTSFDEGFPPELQNRLRGTRVSSTAQIERIAAQLDPEQLGSSRVAAAGAPIISKEGNVLVGNGRVTALRRVLGADDVPAGSYRDFLKKNAAKFGIDPKQVDELDSPILVRVLGDDVDEFKFVREANESVGQQLSATEKALDDASRLSDDTLALLKDDDLALEKSTEFINRFAREVIGPSEMNSFVDSQGRVSAEGKRRIRNAIFARAFDDVDTIENVVESNDQNFKNISNALFTTSPAFAKTKGGKFGVNERLVEAVDQLVQAKKRGIRLDQQLSQRTIGGKDPDNVTKALAEVLDKNKSKPAVLRRFLSRLANTTAQAEQAASQPSLLGSVDKIDTQEILETVIRRVADEGDIGVPNQKGLFQEQQAASGTGSDAPSGRQTRAAAAAGRGGEDTSLPERQSKELREALSEAEEAMGRPLTDDEIQTIENALAFEEQADITLPEGKTSLEKARSTGTEEDAITILKKTKGRGAPKGAAVGAFRKTATSSVDTELLGLPEIVELSQELMGGKMPMIAKRMARGRDVLGFFSPSKGEITLRADIFKDPDLTKRVLAHEIGHLVDWLPDNTMKRGNILGSIASLKRFLKSELIDPAGTFKNKEIRTELKHLSAIWRPFSAKDATNKAYMQYRNSSRELYADAISALINDPVLLETEAPVFYRAFHHFLDRKPDVKRLYFELLNRKAGGRAAEVSSARLRDMFERGEEAFKARLEDKTTMGKVAQSLRIAFVDSFDGLLTKVRTLEKNLPASKNPRYSIEKMLYSNSEAVEHMIQLKSGILDPLEDAGISLNDFDEYAFSRRVLADRGDLANPLGIDKPRAKEIIGLMEERLGAEKFAKLKELHSGMFEWRKPILRVMRESEMYSDETMKALEENTDYVTFNVVKHMNKNYGGYVSNVIHQQIGTFDDIASPLTSTVLKDQSIIYSVNKNNALRKTVEFIQENYPDEILPANYKLQISGGKMISVPAKPENRDMGLIAYLDKGKVRGFYVEKNIADAFANNEFESQAFQVAARAMDLLAKPFREVFINKNVGFWMFNTVRDNWRAGTQLPGARIVNFLPHVAQSVKPAWRFVTRVPDEVISEMNKNNELISVVSNDGLSAFDRQIEKELVKFGLAPNKWENGITKPFLKFFDGMEKLGSFFEVQPKVASHLYLRQRFPNMPDEEIRHLVTTMGGSPSFLRKGKLYPFYNNIFLFSNAIKEGMRADLKYAQKNPASFAVKVAFGSAILPKTLMWGAAAGVFGKGIKQIMDGASEYDKANYHIIPIGLTEDGKSIYIRVPNPEPVRYIGGVYWKLLNQSPTQSATEIFDMTAGQAPGLNPAFSIIKDSVEFLSGRNPYDEFRQRTVIEEQAFKAGGWEKYRQFFKHLAGELGANSFVVMNVNNGREASNTLEEVYGIPIVGPLVSRFVKVTDQGHRERERAEEKEAEKKNAKAILAAREAAHKVYRGETLTPEEKRAIKKKKRSFQNELKRLKGKK